MGGRYLPGALFFGAVTCLAAAGAMTYGCVTAPPVTLPAPRQHRPTILHASVVPPPDQLLTQWPADNAFLVPVELEDTNEAFYYSVFVDYNPDTNSAPAVFMAVLPSVATFDGGVAVVEFLLTPPDSTLCHRIEFLVAHQFNQGSNHTPNSIGGDIVSWLYNAGGGPAGCPLYDAGALQGGAFVDATQDTLPIVPDSGGEL